MGLLRTSRMCTGGGARGTRVPSSATASRSRWHLQTHRVRCTTAIFAQGWGRLCRSAITLPPHCCHCNLSPRGGEPEIETALFFSHPIAVYDRQVAELHRDAFDEWRNALPDKQQALVDQLRMVLCLQTIPMHTCQNLRNTRDNCQCC